jgi:hypothetical protein
LLKSLAAFLLLAAAPFAVIRVWAQSPDADSDGMPDAWETRYGLDPDDPADAAGDPDADGLANLQEYQCGTSPVSDDTDGDRLLDGWEIDNDFDPASGLTPDLLGWWRFDEASGSDVVDHGDNGNDAEIRATNRVVRVSGAPVGGALRYDGVLDPDDPALDGHVVSEGLAAHTLSNAFTAAAWVRPDSFVPYAPILAKVADPDAWDDGFALYALGDGAFGAFVSAFGDATNRLQHAAAATTNEWRHLCLVYDGASAYLYVDGAAVAEAAIATGSVINEAPLVIGSLVGSAGTRPWHGDIADTRIYAAALSEADILSLLETYADPDGDGLDNLQEQAFGSDPRAADSDGDGLSDALEFEHGTDPRAADSDGDGLSDADEIRLGRDPLAAGAAAPSATILHVHTPME